MGMALLIRTAVWAFGLLNLVMFHVTRGRLILHEFGDVPGLSCHLAGARSTESTRIIVPCFKSGDGWIIVSPTAPDDKEPAWSSALRDAERVHVEDGGRRVRVDVRSLHDLSAREQRKIRVQAPWALQARISRRWRRPVFRLTPC